MIDEPGCTAGSRISAMPGARPHRQQPQVARDLAELDGDAPQRARVADDVAHALRDAKAVGRRAQAAGFVSRARAADRERRVVVARIQAGADRGRAEIELVQRVDRGIGRVGGGVRHAA